MLPLTSVLDQYLEDDDTVSINSCPARPAPTSGAREAAYRRLLEFGDKLAERVKDVPEAEINAAIDEATNYVRHH